MINKVNVGKYHMAHHFSKSLTTPTKHFQMIIKRTPYLQVQAINYRLMTKNLDQM